MRRNSVLNNNYVYICLISMQDFKISVCFNESELSVIQTFRSVRVAHVVCGPIRIHMGVSCGSINCNEFTPVHLTTIHFRWIAHKNMFNLYYLVISRHLFFCFKCLWIYFVYEVCLCTDIVVSFILDKAHICVVRWLYVGGE